MASHNEGKVRELGELFEPYGIECVSAGSLSLPEPEETGETFEANALLKAHAAAAGSGMIAIADDSGLEVEALGGYPGIHSARWGGPAKDFDHAMQRVQAALEATGGGFRRANFTCALALAAPNGEEAVFTPRVRRHRLAAARRPGFRLRSDLRSGRIRGDIRRDGPGAEERSLAPYAGLRAADRSDLC